LQGHIIFVSVRSLTAVQDLVVLESSSGGGLITVMTDDGYIKLTINL
jgi:hypothetical protein